MNAPSDPPTACESPEGDLRGTAPVQNPIRKPPLKGVSLVAAYRAARASQRSELRASLHETHLARRRSREERLGRDSARPAQAASAADVEPTLPAEPVPAASGSETISGSIFANLVSLAVAERDSAIAAAEVAAPVTEPAPVELAVPSEPAPEPPASEPAPSAEAAPEEAAPDLSQEPAPEPAPEPTPEPAPEPAPAEQRAYDPPLAEIGFGPGMLIRLSQLGLHTTGDLAQANASDLRAALGDISRLVDVETWISNARQTTRAGG